MRIRLVAVAVLSAIALTACRNPTTVAEATEGVLRVIPRRNLSTVAEGTAGDLFSVFRSNESTINKAYKVTAFRTAAATAEEEAAASVDTLADRLTTYGQAKVKSKLEQMLCEARLYANDQQGDVAVFKPWVDRQFAAIQVPLTKAGVETVAARLNSWINDKTSTYTLACIAWARSQRWS